MTKSSKAGAVILMLAIVSGSAAIADEAAPLQPKPDVSSGVGAFFKAVLAPLDNVTRPIDRMATPLTGAPDYASTPAVAAPLSKRSTITPSALQDHDADKTTDPTAPSR